MVGKLQSKTNIKIKIKKSDTFQVKNFFLEITLRSLKKKWLKRWAREQRGLGSKPTYTILLCAWEKYFTAISPAWWSWQALLNDVICLLNYKRTAISWYLRKQWLKISGHATC